MMNRSTLVALIENEGNFEEFEYAGLKCVIQRNRLDAWCGYVGVTPEYSLYGFDYNDLIEVPKEIKERKVDIDKIGVMNFFAFCLKKQAGEEEIGDEIPVGLALDVHGGITFSEGALADGRTWNGKRCEEFVSTGDDKIWWFGFDCGHSGDLVPELILNEKFKEMRNIFNQHETYRDKEYVLAETKSLAEQIAKFKIT